MSTPAAPPTTSATPTVLLIAPNVSQQFGGEAVKALQIARELARQGANVYQITHSRVRKELEAKFPDVRAYYVEDNLLQKFFWHSRILRPLLRISFQYFAARRAEQLLKDHPGAIVHVTSPISPVQPHFAVKGAPLVLGPLNGNVHYPPGFRGREDALHWFRRVAHGPSQVLHRIFFPGNRRADRVLVSGGERSFASLRLAGCSNDRLVASIDSGVDARIADAPRIEHRGENTRFVHSGRLVDYKGADLAIKALAQTKTRATLDIVGRGPKRATLDALAKRLNVADRVTFIDWIDHAKVSEVMRPYRAFVFPSLAEANGIVVQEAMMLGLPVICLDWGGPQMLVTPETGVLIEPRDEAYVTAELARAMDRLATDPAAAERMSIASRDRAVAEGFAWPEIIRRWIEMYRQLKA